MSIIDYFLLLSLNGFSTIYFFMAVVNFRLIFLAEGKKKKIIIRIVALIFTAIGTALALCAPPVYSITIFSIALTLFVFGEIIRKYRQKRLTATPIKSSISLQGLFKPFTTFDLQTRRYIVKNSKWTGQSIKIVHITDLHMTPNLPLSYYQAVIDRVEQENPDYLFYTGDFISSPKDMDALAFILKPIGKEGDFAILGNHDHWAYPENIITLLKEKNITTLVNETRELSINGNSFHLSSMDYPWGSKTPILPDVKNDNKLHITLTHTPDNIDILVPQEIDIVFAGHNHGGQIRLPIIGPLIVPAYKGRLFDRGHFKVKNTDLFVSSGIGAAFPPFRVYCEPDIFVVTIEGAS